MEFLKRIGGAIAFILLLLPCIFAAIYAEKLNTASTLAAWGVGIGVAVIEGSIIMFLARTKTQGTLFLALAMVIAGAVPAYYWIARPTLVLKPFQAHLQEYLATASSNNPDQGATAADQPLRGKLVPVDMKTRTIDPVFFDLANDLRPRNPEEIGAIAALWCYEHQVGTYGDKGGAYQEQCTVMVLDKTTATLLASRSFIGPMPPSKSDNGTSQTGAKPYKEMSEYLNSLPHR